MRHYGGIVGRLLALFFVSFHYHDVSGHSINRDTLHDILQIFLSQEELSDLTNMMSSVL